MSTFSKILVGVPEKINNKISSIRYAYQHEYLRNNLKSCGRGVVFHGKIVMSNPEMVEIGDNVHIAENAYIASLGGLTIGSNTHISRNLVLYTNNHNYRGKALPYDEVLVKKPVSIGENVWICMNVKIVPGVNIGEGAVIGMGTTVNKDVPPLAIIGSPPFKILKYRDAKHYHKLKKEKQFGGKDGYLLTG